MFALNHHAPLPVTDTRRLRRGLPLEGGGEAIANPRSGDAETGDLRRLTEWFTGPREEVIRRDPDQSWWLHRRWKDDRDQLQKFPNRKHFA
ncbi:MAG: hypothetical protein GTO03_04710 [Planctomycetales bacterium]|nr:hypothetical protein [Planctomycetales bacterium]